VAVSVSPPKTALQKMPYGKAHFYITNSTYRTKDLVSSRNELPQRTRNLNTESLKDLSLERAGYQNDFDIPAFLDI
jgi:hypothetical protein